MAPGIASIEPARAPMRREWLCGVGMGGGLHASIHSLVTSLHTLHFSSLFRSWRVLALTSYVLVLRQTDVRRESVECPIVHRYTIGIRRYGYVLIRIEIFRFSSVFVLHLNSTLSDSALPGNPGGTLTPDTRGGARVSELGEAPAGIRIGREGTT